MSEQIPDLPEVAYTYYLPRNKPRRLGKFRRRNLKG